MIQCMLVGHQDSSFKICYANDNRDECIEKYFEGDSLQKIVDYLGDKQFLCGDQLRFVDFFLYEMCNFIDGMCEGSRRIFDTFPTLESHYERVKAVPEFAAFLASDKYVEHRNVPTIYKTSF